MTSVPAKAPVQRVLHVAATSLPHLNGYTMRLRSIVLTQKDQGLTPVVLTSPFYPGRLPPGNQTTIDGVRHLRAAHPSETGSKVAARLHALRRRRGVLGAAASVVEETLLMRAFRGRITEAAHEVGAELIHAHTPYRCALPAIAAARSMGLPVVYEVRGTWEDTAVSDGLLRENGLGYRHIRRQETRTMRSADAVVAICRQLAVEVGSRGIPTERIFVAPNGADLERLEAAPSNTDPDLAKTIECLGGMPVVGYVGSLRPLEGIDQLLEAIAALKAQGIPVKGLVVGGGPSLAPLRELTRTLSLDGDVVFTGAVPPDRVGSYYDLIDVFVVSRRSSRVTDLVTPIKPLEAMSRGKAVIMSDLPSLRELSPSPGIAAYYQQGDAAALAAVCAELLGDDKKRRSMGEAARYWVEHERSWTASLKQLPEVYAMARSRVKGLR